MADPTDGDRIFEAHLDNVAVQRFGGLKPLRRRIKAAFDEEGIEIPFPQQTVWHRSTPVAQANGDRS